MARASNLERRLGGLGKANGGAGNRGGRGEDLAGEARLGQRAQGEAGLEGSGCGETGWDGSIPRGAGR